MSEDAAVNYGPLALLVGKWYGDRGMDVVTESDGIEKSPYFETIVCEEAGDVTNAEQQILSVIRYHQVVSRKSTNKVFHDQVGYWMWCEATGQVTHSLVIPRAVAVISEGAASEENGVVTLAVKTVANTNAIAESEFMAKKARTTAFILEMKVSKDELSYNQTTKLDIYNQRDFDHTDRNKLTRVS